jgi:hypothetical protein
MAKGAMKAKVPPKLNTKDLQDGSFEKKANSMKGQNPNSLVEDRFPSGGAK